VNTVTNDITQGKWAIMICIDTKEDDWITVTEDTGRCDWNLKPLLFDDINDALKYAEQWTIEGKEKNVRVVSYDG